MKVCTEGQRIRTEKKMRCMVYQKRPPVEVVEQIVKHWPKKKKKVLIFITVNKDYGIRSQNKRGEKVECLTGILSSWTEADGGRRALHGERRCARGLHRSAAAQTAKVDQRLCTHEHSRTPLLSWNQQLQNAVFWHLYLQALVQTIKAGGSRCVECPGLSRWVQWLSRAGPYTC